MTFLRSAAFAIAGSTLLALTIQLTNTTHTAAAILPPAHLPAAGQKLINVTVLLDLSDRIKEPDQPQRDEAIVQATAHWFQAWIKERNAFAAKGCYAVAFEPYPAKMPNLSAVTASMHYDLRQEGKQLSEQLKYRKETYVTVVPNVTKGVHQLYQYVTQQPYKGADLWGFMHDNYMQRYWVDKSTHRNVLVVVTDGYIDHLKYHKVPAQGNKVAYINDDYIANNLIKKAGFTSNNWQAKYTAGKYGLQVPAGVDLQGVEVLVLGEYTYGRPPLYDDIVARYVTDWFKGMGASRVVVRKTDLASLAQQDLLQFLQ
jgi:hypothetical protein